MRSADIKIRFDTYLTECRRHIDIIKRDLSELEEYFPLSEQDIDILLGFREKVALLDQIAYRFIKFQDTLGKLLRYYLLKEGENIDNMTMIDIVNYVEKLNFPINEDLWMEIRVLRNSITHDYPDTYDEVAQALNNLKELLPILEKALTFFER